MASTPTGGSTSTSSSGDPLRVAVVLGSTREGRFGPVVAKWLLGHAEPRTDMDVDLVDLLATPVPQALPGFGAPVADADLALLREITPRLAAADAFVLVTPEYNHSYPASLKNAIDWHNQQWHAKPVGFVSYGGISGGLRAVEHLRTVLAEQHTVTIRNTVSFHDCGARFDQDGRAVDPAADGAAKSMLDQLAWWAHALRDARQARPYAV
ncbi:NADPH-dependent FMN reductase [Streptomyces sp. NBC_01198]|uniref:NADPH-dependent FMN reductase n=1 Tax=Streptomyces sp. NBC_01198 TaxID=2903769 RepID=UPI002E130338|nr:NAD(P)H-dependent oxidoreductase [Streptomyces sp. NBC_01198]